MLLLTDLLQITRSMLAAAETANWEKIEEMEVQRKVLLKKLAATIDSLDWQGYSSEVIDKHMREVLALNNRIIDLGLQAKVELAEIIGNIQRGRKAMNVYYRTT